MQKITTWVWFDTEAEAAAEFYTSIFPSSSNKTTPASAPESSAACRMIRFKSLSGSFSEAIQRATRIKASRPPRGGRPG